MTPSLGEVQATALKAARGAGLPWGACEDAGAATRWLWARGIDSVSALAAVLSANDAERCPLRVGAALSDGASLPWKGELRGVALLAHFLRGRSASIRWQGGELFVAEQDVALAGQPPLELCAVVVSPGAGQGKTLSRAGRRPIDPAAWRLLKRLEAQTYAPPTEASRAGAGAGLTDND